MQRIRLLIWGATLLVALLATYANHFHNSFHFDDSHTIEGNPYIRDLRNIPKFFTDSRMSTTNPQNQIYRPLVSASLAVDYRLAGGLDPLWYHIDVFAWYVVQLALMVLLFVEIMNLTGDRPRHRSQNATVALFAVAWYGLHPVSAETVNYMYQRGDLYSTLGVVAGLVVYAYWPQYRRFGLYLVPALLGMLAKQSALMFAPMLFVYILLFETDPVSNPKPGGPEGKSEKGDVRSVSSSLFPVRSLYLAALHSAPAFVLSGVYYVFQGAMTSPTLRLEVTSRVQYWLTQPIVLLHYFKSFFLPTELSADTDRQLVTNLFSEASLIGLAFLYAFFLAIRYALRRRELRPVSFGLLWFIIASVPTSIIPLSEVENDHRMFFPFVGLALAVSWAGAAFVEKKAAVLGARPRLRTALIVGAFCMLAAYAYGAHVRNEVWHTEESLWKDVTVKSPHNGRGLMNYGLTQMGKGDYRTALDYFQRAQLYAPNYSLLYINQAIAYAGLGKDAEAENHFRGAAALAPREAQSYYFYGRWLKAKGRTSEAITHLQVAVELNPAYLEPRYLLMQVYSEQKEMARLKVLAEETLSLFPNDKGSAQYLAVVHAADTGIQTAELAAKQSPSPEAFLNLSLRYEQAGRHEDCIRVSKEALKLRPDYAEAYNNIAAGYEAMGRWDEAIEAAQQALKLKPDFQLARNNLNYSLNQKRLKDSLDARKQ